MYKEACAPAIKDVSSGDSPQDTITMGEEDTKVSICYNVLVSQNEELLLIQVDSLLDDMDDFLDENSLEYISQSIKDLDLAINKAEKLRLIFRGKHTELCAMMKERYEDVHRQRFDEKLLLIKSLEPYTGCMHILFIQYCHTTNINGCE